MKILYTAIDQRVPAAHGGSVHVTSVAEGLAALGHEVHAVVQSSDQPFPPGRVRWWPMGPPFGIRQLRLLRAPDVQRLAKRIGPDVVIERYYNFGGEGILAARRAGAAAVLEVNAPIVDDPGSVKQVIDALLLIRPMKRWREWQCRAADLIVTPSARILLDGLPPERVLQIEWGADTERIHPGAVGVAPFERLRSETVAIFIGAFRAWHGAIALVHAIRRLHARGRQDIKAVLVGEGPELDRVRRAAEGLSGVTFTGPLPHDRIPACLAAADIGVAPFDVAAHPPLAREFYWSPLKVFEYMAAGLPVVTPRLERLAHIVRDGREGVLYDPADPEGLARAIEWLTSPEDRAAMGRAARERVVQHFSWQQHCRQLDRAIRDARSAARSVSECAS
jgi:glycosyltransferase involved in cell wall biosynthesis